MQYLLTTRFGFKPSEIIMLTDDQNAPQFWPTRANMVRLKYHCLRELTFLIYHSAMCCWADRTAMCFAHAQLYQMQLLTWDCRPGDSLFFHFSGAAHVAYFRAPLDLCFMVLGWGTLQSGSAALAAGPVHGAGCMLHDGLGLVHAGHGTRVHDTVGDEPDGMNEAICPCDFKMAGYIVDDEMNRQVPCSEAPRTTQAECNHLRYHVMKRCDMCRLLVNPLPVGVRLHAVIDACHSGSLLDLEWKCKVKAAPSPFLDPPLRWHVMMGLRAQQLCLPVAPVPEEGFPLPVSVPQVKSSGIHWKPEYTQPPRVYKAGPPSPYLHAGCLPLALRPLFWTRLLPFLRRCSTSSCRSRQHESTGLAPAMHALPVAGECCLARPCM
jgi:hypothetical protein